MLSQNYIKKGKILIFLDVLQHFFVYMFLGIFGTPLLLLIIVLLVYFINQALALSALKNAFGKLMHFYTET